jgi:hypothetical protein
MFITGQAETRDDDDDDAHWLSVVKMMHMPQGLCLNAYDWP